MEIVLSLLGEKTYFELPYQVIGWVGWVVLIFGLIIMLTKLARLRREKQKPKNLLIFLLIAAVPLCSLFFGIRLPEDQTLPVPITPVEYFSPALMFFAALPWVLAAGFIGPVAAGLIGFLSGITAMVWETHSLYTPIEISAMALLFGYVIRQRYRTSIYRLLRHPFFGAIFVSLASIPFFLLTSFLSGKGSLALRVDYAVTHVWPLLISQGGQLLIASLFGEAIYIARPKTWGGRGSLIPSPEETSLLSRFFSRTVPVLVTLVVALLVGDWVVAGYSARRLINDQLANSARIAAESLPYFLESGQSQIANLAKPDLLTLSPVEVESAFQDDIQMTFFFRQLYLFDGNGRPVGGFPVSDYSQLKISSEENAGLRLALKGVPVQIYTVPPVPGENSAQIAFIASIRNETGQPMGVLLGRTDLNSNPVTLSSMQALIEVNNSGGEGIILDEKFRILYHPLPNLVMTNYLGKTPSTALFFDDTSPTGTRQLVYSQPLLGQPWTVLVKVPAEQVQRLALTLSLPLLGILFLLLTVLLVALQLGIKSVANSLQNLANETTLIAQGHLDTPLNLDGEDEIGRLQKAFEKMRVSLRTRLFELNRLLTVSQGTASSLNIEDAILPVLEAAAVYGATSARVVLIRDVDDDGQQQSLYTQGIGSSTEDYSSLDRQMFDFMREQLSLSIPNSNRLRILRSIGQRIPGALAAAALKHENEYFGALWIGYDNPQTITAEQMQFLKTLAGQATFTAVNARLYASTDLERRRLEAVLTSTPEPVLMFDRNMNLVLCNPAAHNVKGLLADAQPGTPLTEVLQANILIDLILSGEANKVLSREVTLENNRVYQASVSGVVNDNRLVGKICILQDITHYKELDTLKTELVATVSHDLRSPLTLMRGYATMLQMVGELNDQQKSYVAKINNGVESMSKLVGNLLDLSRIESGISLKLTKISAQTIIESVMTSLKPQANQKKIEFTSKQTDTTPIMVEADADLLIQCLYNLVENAIKYTAINGKVDVGLIEHDKKIVFSVTDNGIGIAPLDLPHMFEKFYRSNRRESYQQRGTGLGLAIVKSIIERHNGRVWVESQLGKGSTFSLEVPLNQNKDGL
jgi:two-component system NtrC family sensor kinase